MKTKKGIVLGPLEIANEYGTIHIFKNSLPKGERIWIYYDSLNRIKKIEQMSKIVVNKAVISKRYNHR